jgi:hypothetical protein
MTWNNHVVLYHCILSVLTHVVLDRGYKMCDHDYVVDNDVAGHGPAQYFCRPIFICRS